MHQRFRVRGMCDTVALLLLASFSPVSPCICYHAVSFLFLVFYITAPPGPVTVPILLSLGVGVMKAQKDKQMALRVLEDAAVRQSEGEQWVTIVVIGTQMVLGHVAPLIHNMLLAVHACHLQSPWCLLTRGQHGCLRWHCCTDLGP